MKTSNKEAQQPGRIYFFDWLRIIAFIVVVLIHCIHMFGELYKTQANISIKEAGDGQTYFISFLVQWSMSLFFLLAGASTWLTLNRKTPRQFIQGRCWRLLMPLLIAFIPMVPFQAYFEMTSNGQFSGTLLEFYPFFLENILFNGNVQWIIVNIHHLWFLTYLFGISLITLPLCLYLRSEAGQTWIERLTGICTQPAGLLLLVLPIAIVQISLRASFPVYCSLTDAITWTLFYMYGYILFANPGIRQALHQQARMALGLGIAGFVVMLVLWQVGALHSWLSAPDYSAGCLIFQALGSLILWSWLIVTLAFGDIYLNTTSSLLKYSSVASFWWYLVHFPLVVIIAYYALPFHLNMVATFILISSSSFASTFILTELLLRMQDALALLKTKLRTTVSPANSTQNSHFSPGLRQLVNWLKRGSYALSMKLACSFRIDRSFYTNEKSLL